MMLAKLAIPPRRPTLAVLSGGWSNRAPWDWTGSVTAPEPIVAMSFLAVGGEIHWIRSEKEARSRLDVRLLLGRYDAAGRDVQPNFGIGENSVRSRALLETADYVPDIPASQEVSVGVCFPFCMSFGTPQVSLYGLLLLRQQVEGARLGIWHLKPEYSNHLEEPWKRVFTHGRGGVLQGAQSMVELTAPPNGGPAERFVKSGADGGPPSVS